MMQAVRHALRRARAVTAPAPSPAQIEAGNYRKGKVRLHGLTVTLENPKGSTRSGVSRAGVAWSTVMAHDYGYLNGYVGADKDQVDVFVGPHPESALVFIVDQVDERGTFDEHKVLMGFRNEAEARAGYLANYRAGWTVGPITTLTLPQFCRWLEEGNTARPAAGRTRFLVKASGIIKRSGRNVLLVDKNGRPHWRRSLRGGAPIERQPRPWPLEFPDVIVHTGLRQLYAAAATPGEALEEGRSAAYRRAKTAADAEAAVAVVLAIAHPGPLRQLGALYPGARVVAIHAADQSTSANGLSVAYAVHVARVAHLAYDDGVVQVSRVAHTDASAIDRLVRQAQFSGPVQPGSRYILVDDVVSSGGGFGVLRRYIEQHGGHVVAATALAAPAPTPALGSSLHLAMRLETRRALDTRFDAAKLTALLRDYGIAEDYRELTNREGRFLLSVGSLDALRGRIAAAQCKETVRGDRTGVRRGAGPQDRRPLGKSASAPSTPLVFFAKATQLDLFGHRVVQKPGSRGGRYYLGEHGEVHYGARPVPAAVAPVRSAPPAQRSLLEHEPPGGWEERDKVTPDPAMLRAEWERKGALFDQLEPAQQDAILRHYDFTREQWNARSLEERGQRLQQALDLRAAQPVAPSASRAPAPSAARPSPADERPTAFVPYDQGGRDWQVSEQDFIAKTFEREVAHADRNVLGWQRMLDQTMRASERQRATDNIAHWTKTAARLRSAGVTPSEMQHWRDSYIELVKKAISKGLPVPTPVIEQRPEFRKARDARARYDKGRHTSFANESAAVNREHQAVVGFKVKRQDGKAITPKQIEEIHRGVAEVEEVLGPLAELLRRSDLTIAHTSGKHPFLKNAGGLYSVGERTVSVGIADGMGQPIPALAHELAHWLDDESGMMLGHRARLNWRSNSKPIYTPSLAAGEEQAALVRQARQTMTRTREVRGLLKERQNAQTTPEAKARVERVQVQLGPYWERPHEIFARLVEQYVTTVRGQGGVASEADYTNKPGWWSAEDFTALMPMVAREIGRRLQILGGDPSHVTGERVDINARGTAAGFVDAADAQAQVRADVAGGFDRIDQHAAHLGRLLVYNPSHPHREAWQTQLAELQRQLTARDRRVLQLDPEARAALLNAGAERLTPLIAPEGETMAKGWVLGRFLDRLLGKAEQLMLFGHQVLTVQAPASRGGHGYYAENGQWRYGERATPAPPAPTATTTPGTRVKWADLAEWIHAAEVIAHRHITRHDSTAHVQEQAHLAALDRDTIEATNDPAVLRRAQGVLRAARPTRGNGRAEHPATERLQWVNNRLAALGERPTQPAAFRVGDDGSVHPVAASVAAAETVATEENAA